MVLLITNKCGANMPPAIADAPFLQIRAVDTTASEGAVRLLETLYVERAHTMWKSPAVLEWLQVCPVPSPAPRPAPCTTTNPTTTTAMPPFPFPLPPLRTHVVTSTGTRTQHTVLQGGGGGGVSPLCGVHLRQSAGTPNVGLWCFVVVVLTGSFSFILPPCDRCDRCDH